MSIPGNNEPKHKRSNLQRHLGPIHGMALSLLTALSGIPHAVHSAVIYESALPGEPRQRSGWTLDAQLMGSRFSLDRTVKVESVGGNLFGSGTLFTAIVSLQSPTALPSGNPFDGSTRAFSLFRAPTLLGRDVTVPLSVVLPAGDYALIFGSQWFGATGRGAMTYANVDIPGPESFFSWHTSQLPHHWLEPAAPGDLRQMRFFVNGISDPLQPTLRIGANGKLLGARNVDVNGVLYDVEFLDGTCIDLFSGCDDFEDFSFATAADATHAMSVLLNTVLNDTPAGLFDSDSSLTRGCAPTMMGLCAIYTPFWGVTDEYPEAVLRARAVNQDAPLHQYDGVSDDDYGPKDMDFGPPVDWMTWARWTPVPVSEPGMFSYLIMIALAGGGARLTQRTSATAS